MLEMSAQHLALLPRPRLFAAVATFVLTAIYATIDFIAPGEINVAILYASSVTVAGWTQSRAFLWLTTAVSVLLAYGGLLFGPQPDEAAFEFYIDRSFVVLGLIIIAAIVDQRIKLIDRLDRARDAEAQQNQTLRETEDDLRRVNEQLEERVEREVSRRIEAEQSLQHAQKMEALGQLTGGIAHDFNNLLTTVIGNLDLIDHCLAVDDPLRRFSGSARHGAEQGARLVKRLLSFARQEPLDPEVIEVEPVLSGVVALARPTVSDAIELALDTRPALWRCCVDEAELESALLNLVINARDAISGPGRITLSAQNVSLDADATDLRGGDYVRFAVRDTGAGMSPEVAARVFEPFFTTKPVGKGSGLGLAMIYSFAKQSGGTVRIETALRRGTTVQLYVPRTTLPALSEPAASSPASLPTRPATIAVTEADEGVRRFAAESRAGAEHRLQSAEDGKFA